MDNNTTQKHVVLMSKLSGAMSPDGLRGKYKGFLNSLAGGTVVIHRQFDELPKAVGIQI